MMCEDARLLLHAYLDDELDAAQSASMVGHLQTCPACAASYGDHTRLRKALAQPGLYRKAPDALRQQWTTVKPVAPKARRALPTRFVREATNSSATVAPIPSAKAFLTKPARRRSSRRRPGRSLATRALRPRAGLVLGFRKAAQRPTFSSKPVTNISSTGAWTINRSSCAPAPGAFSPYLIRRKSTTFR